MAMSWLGTTQTNARVFGKKSNISHNTNVGSDIFGHSTSSVSRTVSASAAEDFDENPFATIKVKPASEASRERLRTLSENSLSRLQEVPTVNKPKRKAKEEAPDQKKTRARATSPAATRLNEAPSPLHEQQSSSSNTFTFSASDISGLGSTYPSRYFELH